MKPPTTSKPGESFTAFCLKLLCVGFILPPVWVVLVAVIVEHWRERGQL
jgi:hypothetical protein